MNDKVAATSYDQVPYPDLSYTQTHPNRLATVATLLGTSPPVPDHCRVLELGCASGGNLIPMAYSLPESEFLGMDISAHQIAKGQATIEALGLKNISLRHLDILEVNAELGQFDYIIAHGVFSWVPRLVQDKLLDICRQNLTPSGVAYVSYNTYPGWHMLGIMREMMLYHIRSLSDPWERAAHARGLLDFLAESVPADSSAYGSFLNMYAKFLKGELEGAKSRSDSVLLHDELEETNEPIYFYKFAERAAQHGLQYLGEAEFRTMLDNNFSPQVSETLRAMAKSIVDLEQYMDFLRNRTFRQTLLCHQDVRVNRKMKPERMTTFFVASRAQAVSPEPDIRSATVEQFRCSNGATLSTDHPVSKAAMLCLAEVWPQAIKFDELLCEARSRLGLNTARAQDVDAVADDISRDAQALAVNLLTGYGYSSSLIELYARAPHFVAHVSERPVASPCARFHAQNSTLVTNLRHERVNLDEFDRYLLSCLDGSHDRAALVENLAAGPVADSRLVLQQEGGRVENAEQIGVLLAKELEKRLGWLARAAILVG